MLTGQLGISVSISVGWLEYIYSTSQMVGSFRSQHFIAGEVEPWKESQASPLLGLSLAQAAVGASC